MDSYQTEKLKTFVSVHGEHAVRLQKTAVNDAIQCNVCNHGCRIRTGGHGLCNAVWNTGDKLVWSNYGFISGYRQIKIEQISILHYRPASDIMFFGSIGCNFSCIFCNNREISHTSPVFYATQYRLSPTDVVSLATKAGVSGIAFLGNEPTIQFDFILDVAPLAKAAGLYVALHSNGYMSNEAVKQLTPYVDAISISIKGLGDPESYAKWLMKPAEPRHVLDNIKAFYESGVHTEVVGLAMREHCDAERYAAVTASWLVQNVSEQMPLGIENMQPIHLKTWNPTYMLSTGKLNKLAQIARDNGLKHVYNRGTFQRELPTCCPNCGSVVVERKARSGWEHGKYKGTGVQSTDTPKYAVSTKGIDEHGYCTRCGAEIYGVFNEPERVTDKPEIINVGRNHPCPCGSGLKYKKCCLAKDILERVER